MGGEMSKPSIAPRVRVRAGGAAEGGAETVGSPCTGRTTPLSQLGAATQAVAPI